MGHHGWNGDPPPTEALARERLVAAATRCIDRTGVAKTTLSDVAAEVGVTRQTVYRYFAGMGELHQAVAASGAADFIAAMRSHVTPFTEPVDVVIEAIVFCLDELPLQPRISVLLHGDDEGLFGRGITSATGSSLGAEFLRDLPVSWSSAGIDEHGPDDPDGLGELDGLDGLAELMLRLIGSLLQHPPATPRSPDELRAFLRRWIGPALAPLG